MFEVNFILTKAPIELLNNTYTSRIPHAYAPQWHLLSSRYPRQRKKTYQYDLFCQCTLVVILVTIAFLSRKWSEVDWWHCNVRLTVGLLSWYYANQEKKRVTCSPRDRMIFQLLAGPGSQAKKRKRLLAVLVKVPRLVIPYPV